MRFFLFVWFILPFHLCFAIEVRSVSTAETWSEARALCLELGDTWDLPKVSEVLEYIELFEKYNFYLYKDSETKRASKIQMIWTRSDEEELNQQLILKSQVMKVMDEGANLDSVLHSEFRTYRLRSYRNLLIENIDELSQSQTGASKVGLLDIYGLKQVAEAFKMNREKSVSRQLQELAMDFETFVSYKMLILLSKPTRSDIQTEIENLGNELEVLERGLRVVCVQSQH